LAAEDSGVTALTWCSKTNGRVLKWKEEYSYWPEGDILMTSGNIEWEKFNGTSFSI
jgi:hypothetical protein